MTQCCSDKVWKVLICPNCGAGLEKIDSKGAMCRTCDIHYGYSSSGSLDLRLTQPRTYLLDIEIGGYQDLTYSVGYTPLVENTTPQVDFSTNPVPYHLSRELLSYFPKAQNQDSLMLDLGCGGTIHREVCEYAGFEYVGLDFDAPKAPILGDAHALPFQDNSFEFILSIAVLEHIRYPFVMMQEAYRVLQLGGVFLGTVAFLEPYHLNSLYHHTHLGTLNSLLYGGFQVEHIAPHAGWPVLTAQAVMGLFPRMNRRISTTLVLPLQLLHQLWWKLRIIKNRGRTLNENDRIRDTTGAFTFIAYKADQ